jgi:hypothetical protein
MERLIKNGILNIGIEGKISYFSTHSLYAIITNKTNNIVGIGQTDISTPKVYASERRNTSVTKIVIKSLYFISQHLWSVSGHKHINISF